MHRGRSQRDGFVDHHHRRAGGQPAQRSAQHTDAGGHPALGRRHRAKDSVDQRCGVRCGEDVSDEELRFIDVTNDRITADGVAQCLRGGNLGSIRAPAAVHADDGGIAVNRDYRHHQEAIIAAVPGPDQVCGSLVERRPGEQTGERIDIGLGVFGSAQSGDQAAGEHHDDIEEYKGRRDGEGCRQIDRGDPGGHPQAGGGRYRNGKCQECRAVEEGGVTEDEGKRDSDQEPRERVGRDHATDR